jgi:hypothetical protein
MKVSEKFEYFVKLMGELGVPENPVSLRRFRELSGIVTRHDRGQEMSSGDTSKIRPEVSEKLEAMLSENPILTYTDAVKALKKRGGLVKLPPRDYCENWLRYRRKVLGFLKLLQDPSDEKMSSNDAPVTNDLGDDDFSCLFSVFSDDPQGDMDEEEVIDEEKDKERSACTASDAAEADKDGEEEEVSDEDGKEVSDDDEKHRKRSAACGSSDAACPAPKRFRLDKKEKMYSTHSSRMRMHGDLSKKSVPRSAQGSILS